MQLSFNFPLHTILSTCILINVDVAFNKDNFVRVIPLHNSHIHLSGSSHKVNCGNFHGGPCMTRHYNVYARRTLLNLCYVSRDFTTSNDVAFRCWATGTAHITYYKSCANLYERIHDCSLSFWNCVCARAPPSVITWCEPDTHQ